VCVCACEGAFDYMHVRALVQCNCVHVRACLNVFTESTCDFVRVQVCVSGWLVKGSSLVFVHLANTEIHAHTYTHKHTYPHAHTHTNTRTRTIHTYTYTHTDL